MSGDHTERRAGRIPAWLGPWLIPLAIVSVVVAAVNLYVMVAVVLVMAIVVGRWRYLDVRELESRGVYESDRWRIDSVARRAAERYDDRR